MSHFFTPEGELFLERVATESPLVALDFDGTLAPIVSLPEQARLSASVTGILSKIGGLAPLAIITGRSVSDVSSRLGFSPRFVVGNHGMEGLPGLDGTEYSRIANAWQGQIASNFGVHLTEAGVLIEPKGYSISLHYRLSRDRNKALEVIRSTIASLTPQPRIIGGKFVFNLLPPGAPDKFEALLVLLRITGRQTVIFAGDDATDDVVFQQAPRTWLTIRIERGGDHRAQFHLNHQSEVATFLQRLLRALERHQQKSIHARHGAVPSK